MDIHPIIVHFPIALLSLYSLFEIFSIKKIREKDYWFYVKATTLYAGEIGAILAIIFSGTNGGGEIQEIHEKFAFITAALFGIVSAFYSLVWFGKDKLLNFSLKVLSNRLIMIAIGLVGLSIITITGGLGGAMVYGTGFDPLMKPIFQILGVY